MEASDSATEVVAVAVAVVVAVAGVAVVAFVVAGVAGFAAVAAVAAPVAVSAGVAVGRLTDHAVTGNEGHQLGLEDQGCVVVDVQNIPADFDTSDAVTVVDKVVVVHTGGFDQEIASAS